MPLPHPPTGHRRQSSDDSDRTSVISTDSGIGPSVEGVVAQQRKGRLHRNGSSSVPTSGDGTFRRQDGAGKPPAGGRSKSQSDSGRFKVRMAVEVNDPAEEEELNNYTWYWGSMKRPECEKKLQEEGLVGNFVVRLNARGEYIMSFW